MATKPIDFDVRKPPESEVAPVPATPFQLMTMAVRQGISAEQLRILQEMHFKQLEFEAEVEFNEALNKVQASIPLVVPDLTNPQTKSKYASFARLDKIIRPVYTAEGFSVSFNSSDCPIADHSRIIAYLSRGKHTRTYQIDMPIVTTGIQGNAMMTRTHAVGSANTYGKRYLLCDIFNIPVGEDNDGVSAAVAGGDLKRLEAAKTAEELHKVFIELFNAASGDSSRQKVISQARDKCKAQFGKAHGVEVNFK